MNTERALRIYRVLVGAKVHYVRAANRARAVAVAARKHVQVRLASTDEVYQAGKDGVAIEDDEGLPLLGHSSSGVDE